MSDYDFTGAILKINVKFLGKNPEITLAQFFQQGFIDKKIQLCLDSI